MIPLSSGARNRNRRSFFESVTGWDDAVITRKANLQSIILSSLAVADSSQKLSAQQPRQAALFSATLISQP
jgi:hypothetical protein